MDFNFTEEQLALEDTIGRFINKDYSFEARRKIVASEQAYDTNAWSTYAELGLLALPFEEDFGGLDGSALDTYLVMKALAPGLILEPYVSTVVLSGGLLNALGTQQQKEALIPGICDGSTTYAFAHYEPAYRYQEEMVGCRATKTGDNWVLNGQKAAVIDAPSASKLLVSARTSGEASDKAGISVFLLDPAASGVTLKAYKTHDGHYAADITLENVEVPASALIGEQDKAYPAIMDAILKTNVALCAEASGLIKALNDATLEYLKTRKQFGVAIGTFQALQHRMADMAIAAEQANSMALLASIEMQHDDLEHRVRKASGAKAYIGKLARHVSQEAVQMHGGMGVTDELNVAHFFKRVNLINTMFGDHDFHMQRYSDMLVAPTV
ncbi:MAG: pimeloyl-CoA dehydrogenase small subunit [Alcaligenaceae bacterium]|nr:pimeloyl-CoA dehydrogenase small subunit [Alcaligenaceae bacterium]